VAGLNVDRQTTKNLRVDTEATLFTLDLASPCATWSCGATPS
jgi:hypothetical protein